MLYIAFSKSTSSLTVNANGRAVKTDYRYSIIEKSREMFLKSDHAVADELLNLNLDDITAFDDETVNGEGEAYYEQSQIIDAVVYRNKLFARVGNYFESHRVRITMHGRELTVRCSCDDDKRFCVHAVALLYAWVNDAPDFMNLSDVLTEIAEMDKARIMEIVMNILQQQPHLAGEFLKKIKPDWDEIDPEPFI